MPTPSSNLREQARSIWQAAVDAVDAFELVRSAVADPSNVLRDALRGWGRILVVGGGKAGAAMAAGLEAGLGERRERVAGLVNVPEGASRPLERIRLHAGRPAGSNHPTTEGVAGVDEMLALVSSAGPDDVCFCLLSGGGSALMPAPVAEVALQHKQQVTRLLHACGATIDEMNCVRKHLSRVKGGRLAQAFQGGTLCSLIISDVVGDPLDVIASGPTAPDPTTFADALAVLDRFGLRERVPAAIVAHLQKGRAGTVAETLKELPERVHNLVLGNNARALAAASRRAVQLGWPVLNLGAFIEGETREVATVMAGLVRSIQLDGLPLPAPCCVLSGGETTVTLGGQEGKGGRNQEFVLAAALKLGIDRLRTTVILSGGTDGEDGPTDAAGAIAEASTLERARQLGLDAMDSLVRHDAYPFFAAVDGLVKSGLTGTNVMDVRVILVDRVA